MTNSRPIHEVRLGAVKAAVWQNQSGESTYYNVSFQRSYHDGKEWKHTDNFGRDDLLVLAKAADQAHTWICDQRPAVKERK